MRKRHPWLAAALFSIAFLASVSAAQQPTTTASNPVPVRDRASTKGKEPEELVVKAKGHAKPPSQTARVEAAESFRAGARDIQQRHLQRAESEFTRARTLDPGEPRYAEAAEVARQFMVSDLIAAGGRAKREGDDLGARAAIQEAITLDPGNPFAGQYVNEPSAASLSLRSEIKRERRDLNAPIRLQPASAVRSFHLRMDERALIPQVLSAYGIRAIDDQSVPARTIPFDAGNLTFPDALRLLQLATDTFVAPLDVHSVLVLSDTKENRARYQPLIAETFYFPGITGPELTDMQSIARNLLGVEATTVRPGQSSMTLRAPRSELNALAQVYDDLLAGRNEVELDMHAYEVDHLSQNDAGLILPGSASAFNLRSEADSVLAGNAALVQEIVASGEASAGDWQKILAILIASGALSGTVFNNPFVVFGGGLTETGVAWNTSSANMLLDRSDVRSLDQIQLRVTEREEATFRVGERYPVMMGAYSVLNGGAGSSSQTTPEVQYVDLGLTLKAKPSVEASGNILLRVDLEVSALAGSSLNGVPVLTNRQYSGVVPVQGGESALLVSAISKQDSLELTGVPGLSDIPGFAGATNRQDLSNTAELVVLVTPRIVRRARQVAEDPIVISGR